MAKEKFKLSDTSIIGTYEGECADSNITNLNGLDITREVWENVFNSDSYKEAIEHGWYIGYLGHPEGDPDCQDFRKACIVMTDGYIADDGKVYGKFNLIDTPVGRIVKAFQDAGVKFGISVRGAGDIVQNSVDPETFVFRGFDLVTFPAFPESIPEFTAISASADSSKQSKYKAVCAAVRNNMNSLDTVQSINIVQSCFAPQSDEYKLLESKKKAISDTSDEIDPRVNSMTMLYLDAIEENKHLKKELKSIKQKLNATKSDNFRRIKCIERIFSSQTSDLNHVIQEFENKVSMKDKQLIKANSMVKSKSKELRKINETIHTKDDTINRLQNKVSKLENNISIIRASLDKSNSLVDVYKNNNQTLKNKLDNMESDNLKYIKKVESAESKIKSKDEIIAKIETDLNETVKQKSEIEAHALNFDDKYNNLLDNLNSAQTLIDEYQNAYANLYAHALGVNLPNINISKNTNVTSLQNMIRSRSSVNLSSLSEPTPDMDTSYFDEPDDYNDLVTL